MSQRRAGTRGGKEKGSPQEGRICTNAAFELLGRMPRDMSEQAYMLGILFFFFFFTFTLLKGLKVSILVQNIIPFSS